MPLHYAQVLKPLHVARSFTSMLIFSFAVVVSACAASHSINKNKSGSSEDVASTTGDVVEPDPDEDQGPLLWKITTAEGAISYVLASGQDVSARQLIPEVWSAFEGAEELLLEMDLGAAIEALMAREPNLADVLEKEEFEDLLIQLPGMNKELLSRMPASFLASQLAAPRKHPGLNSALAFLEKAKSSKKKVAYLVDDVPAYLGAFESVVSDYKRLRTNLRDSEPAKRGRRKRRRAYLEGRASELNPKSHDTPAYLKILEAENRAWLEPLEAAFHRGNAFAVISETDLLSDNGILKELAARGYAVERALKGRPGSLQLPAPQHLRVDECFEVLQHIFIIAAPEAAEQLQNPGVMRAFALTDQGRALLAMCVVQTTPWYDCVTDGEDIESIEKCDKRHPVAQ